MRERILAVVGAIGMIAAALFVRSLLVGDDGGGGGSATGPGGGGVAVVACTPDLRSVCDALEDDGLIRAAPGSLDLAGATEPDPSIDAWITWDPAPGVANFDAPDTWGPASSLASAPLGVLVADGPGACPATASWSCVLDLVASGLPVGTGTGSTAESLARLYPVGAALVPDGGDFTEIDPLPLRNVVQSTQVRQSDGADQLATFLTRRGALAAVIGPVPALDDAAGRQPGATVTTPEPLATIGIVVAAATSPPAGNPSGTRPTLDPADVLASEATRAALESLGLIPGTGEAASTTTAGEVHSLRGTLR